VIRKEEEEEEVVFSFSSSSSLFFHVTYDVIQSVFIVEIDIRKIPYTKNRRRFLSSLRNKYPTKTFLIQYSFLTS
jgi:hypothetical protein